jgi:rsbT co-antagonist protein RsbR
MTTLERLAHMTMNQRTVAMSILGLFTVGLLAFALTYIAQGAGATRDALTIYGAMVLFSGLWFAYWRGFEWVRLVFVALNVLLAIFLLPPDFVFQQRSFAIILPTILALVLAGPSWIVGSMAVTVIGLYLRFWGQPNLYNDPFTLILLALIAGGMLLGRLVTDNAQQRAEANARQAEGARREIAAQATELERKAGVLETQNEEQRRLLELVSTLEMPVVALADGVILAPVVGHLDSRRAQALIARVLEEVSAQRARLVIMDIAGVPAVDTEVAQSLLRAIQAVRLLGCSVTLTGISAAIAATMTQLGINMAGVNTARNPQEALERMLSTASRVN